MVIGEGREFLSALVVPADGAARTSGGDEELQTALTAMFKSYSRGVAAPEKIRAFRLVPEAFSVDNGMMTPTLKLRRKIIEKNYSELIDEMYAGIV
jgi:long-chain acyl-CoA synthetase